MSTNATPVVKEDFADWLNPMLVKELRQGLKTKVFVIVFVLVQVALVILMGFSLIAHNEPFGYIASMLDGLLWTAIGAALLGLMPLRALTAISEEDKANTLHLVQLTRLSSTRIVWGKWIALVSQMLLLTVAILPYAVLRYFFGGVDIVDDLLALLSMVGASMMLTAGCLVLSTLPMGTRVVLLVSALPTFGMATSAIGIAMAMGGGAKPPALSFIHAGIMTTLFLLALAASRIAPAAENHAGIMRVIALMAAVIATVATMISDHREDSAWFGLLLPILFIAVLQALVERTSDVPSVYAAWMKKGRLAKLAGRVLYPGWATGMIFVALLVALLATAMAHMETWSNPIRLQKNIALAVLLYLALISPVVLLRQQSKMRGWTYALLHAAAMLILAMGETLDGVSNIPDETIAGIMGLMPTAAYFWSFSKVSNSDAFWNATLCGSLIGGVIFCILLVRSRREFKLIRTLEAQAAAPDQAV